MDEIIAEARRLFEHLIDHDGYDVSQACSEADRLIEDCMIGTERQEPYRGQTCPTSGPVMAWLKAEFAEKGV